MELHEKMLKRFGPDFVKAAERGDRVAMAKALRDGLARAGTTKSSRHKRAPLEAMLHKVVRGKSIPGVPDKAVPARPKPAPAARPAAKKKTASK